MKFTGLILAACVAAAQAAPLLKGLAGKPIPDSYIVVLKDGNTAESFNNKFNNIARQNARGGNMPIISRRFKNISGFVTKSANKAVVNALLASPEVEYVEQDQIITIKGSQANPPSWGLPRISSAEPNKNGTYEYNDAAGEGVTAYIIDTGIYTEHEDFGGRAKFGANFIEGSEDTDENGHGTHVAGTIGGTLYGVAKKVSLVGVKVLDAEGSGSTSGVVAGMDWVAENAKNGTKAVVNMSLGGGKSKAIDAAAEKLFKANIPLFVAAGNDETFDACDGSPSGAANAFTVAASDESDKFASFSSFGNCVEIIAPGVGITSSWIGGTKAKKTISGTSMATPHVAGTAALLLSADSSLNGAQAVFDKLVSIAVEGKISGDLKGTPNKLLQNGGSA
ncbi:subtilisin-like serine protease [Actinomortierella wolfii]|nr:subtilisin-like serine protease [Actinomortierella wolfii]KAG0241847.1 subtilisin-like serine protease [Actinomortierella wolfii]